jgi:hypothetical protein
LVGISQSASILIHRRCAARPLSFLSGSGMGFEDPLRVLRVVLPPEGIPLPFPLGGAGGDLFPLPFLLFLSLAGRHVGGAQKPPASEFRIGADTLPAGNDERPSAESGHSGKHKPNQGDHRITPGHGPLPLPVSAGSKSHRAPGCKAGCAAGSPRPSTVRERISGSILRSLKVSATFCPQNRYNNMATDLTESRPRQGK